MVLVIGAVDADEPGRSDLVCASLLSERVAEYAARAGTTKRGTEARDEKERKTRRAGRASTRLRLCSCRPLSLASPIDSPQLWRATLLWQNNSCSPVRSSPTKYLVVWLVRTTCDSFAVPLYYAYQLGLAMALYDDAKRLKRPVDPPGVGRPAEGSRDLQQTSGWRNERRKPPPDPSRRRLLGTQAGQDTLLDIGYFGRWISGEGTSARP